MELQMDIDTKPFASEDSNLRNEPSVVSEELVEIVETIRTQNLNEALTSLLSLVKTHRQKEDLHATLYLCEEIVTLSRDTGDWDFTTDQVVMLCKQRSQFREVKKRIVGLAMTWLDEVASQEAKIRLVVALREITDGQMMLERERAQLTLVLAGIKEAGGDVNGASSVLQELQIETFGSLERHPKCFFLLEQFRLCLLNRDFVRANIVRNKITDRVVKGMKDLEMKYWQLSVVLFYHDDYQWMKLAKTYNKIMELQEEKRAKIEALSNMVMAIILADYNNEQNDMIHRTLEVQKELLDHLPALKRLLVIFSTKELILNLPSQLSSHLHEFRFDGVWDDDQTFFDLLEKRHVQHDIRVIAEYYTRISVVRLSQFLQRSPAEMERQVCEMVTSKQIFARIDRLSGVIRFVRKKGPTEIVNGWRSDINRLLELVDKTCHQIHKEQVVHDAKNARRKK